MTLEHDIDYYQDSYKGFVAFCRIWGKEGLELLDSECSGKFVDKSVDKPKEQE